MTAAILLQPMSANDVVAILATCFGGIVVVIRDLKPS